MRRGGQNPNILRTSYMEAPYAFYCSTTLRLRSEIVRTNELLLLLESKQSYKRRCGGLKCCMQSVQSSTQRTLALTPSWNVTESSSRAWTYFPHSEVSADCNNTYGFCPPHPSLLKGSFFHLVSQVRQWLGFLQLSFVPRWPKNHLNKNPDIT